MSDYKIVEPQMGAPSPTSLTATTQQWPLGYIAKGEDFATGSARVGDGLFQYVVGDTAGPALSRGQAVLMRGNSALLAGTVNRLSNLPLGIAAGPVSASNVYGWVQVQGFCDYARGTNANTSVGATAFVGSTTGQLASTQGAVGARIWGLHFPIQVTADNSLSVTCYLNFPHMGPSSAL
jgi:hypothetical protein